MRRSAPQASGPMVLTTGRLPCRQMGRLDCGGRGLSRPRVQGARAGRTRENGTAVNSGRRGPGRPQALLQRERAAHVPASTPSNTHWARHGTRQHGVQAVPHLAKGIGHPLSNLLLRRALNMKTPSKANALALNLCGFRRLDPPGRVPPRTHSAFRPCEARPGCVRHLLPVPRAVQSRGGCGRRGGGRVAASIRPLPPPPDRPPLHR